MRKILLSTAMVAAIATHAQAEQQLPSPFLVFSCRDGEQVLVIRRLGSGRAVLKLGPLRSPTGEGHAEGVFEYDGWEEDNGSFFFRKDSGFSRLAGNVLLTVDANREEKVTCVRRDDELFFERALTFIGQEQAKAAAELRKRLASLQTSLNNEELRKLAEEAVAQRLREQLTRVTQQLGKEEAARLAELAAAEALRERLRNADSELTAMTLALEQQRKEAEDTLTLLAAALLAKVNLETALTDCQSALATALAKVASLKGTVGDEEGLRARLAEALAAKALAEQAGQDALSEREQLNVLLSEANATLSEQADKSAEAARSEEALIQAIAQLRAQLETLQAAIDTANDKNAN